MKQGLKGSVIALSLLAIGAFAVQGAVAAVVDYVGYAYETGGLVPSDPGDQLSVACTVSQIDPLFQVDLGTQEATLFIDGLVSQGANVNQTTGTTTTIYTGGTIAVYASFDHNHDWGVSPPNPTAPSTFIDGDLVFMGNFTSFTLVLQASGSGVFQGTIDATGGSALAGPCSDCSYTIAGTFSLLTGANIPAGYDLQVDGILDVDSAVDNENISWGELKSQFSAGN